MIVKNSYLKSGFRDEFYKTTMPFVYNLGAAVVILGAMFKLLNLPGGALMLGVGLSTEALIFVLSIFEPKNPEIDWTRVYPELAANYKGDVSRRNATNTPAIVQKMNESLEQAHIDMPLLENLANAMRCFSENMAVVPSFAKLGEITEAYVGNVERATHVIGSIANASDAVNNMLHSFTNVSSKDSFVNCATQIEEMNHTLTTMNVLYKRKLDGMQAQTNSSSLLHEHLENTLKEMEIAGNEAINFRKELTLLNQKVTALNEIYAKTLTAFRG
ncbi:gliding motility protein GldL [Cardinium endosymbiont of Tipula unca]|uniref:type IX secretion system motor protein PorL/GldL n=1 Tax=Cardinium endosymbiont of Tipula unca TaxID=3066216 RepID=UPI0030D4128B